MTTRQRLTPAASRANIIETAVKMGATGLFSLINRDEVAARLGISPTLVSHYFTMPELRHVVIAEGCQRNIPRLIVVGVIEGHPDAIALDDETKRNAISGV